MGKNRYEWGRMGTVKLWSPAVSNNRHYVNTVENKGTVLSLTGCPYWLWFCTTAAAPIRSANLLKMLKTKMQSAARFSNHNGLWFCYAVGWNF